MFIHAILFSFIIFQYLPCLAGRLPENNLETDVGKRVYKMGHISFTFPHASKIRKLDEIGKFVCGEVLDFIRKIFRQ